MLSVCCSSLGVMAAPDFDLGEWDFLPPLDDAGLPDSPPPQLVLVEWAEPVLPSASTMIFADPADAAGDVGEALRFGTAWRQPGSPSWPGWAP